MSLRLRIAGLALGLGVTTLACGGTSSGTSSITPGSGSLSIGTTPSARAAWTTSTVDVNGTSINVSCKGTGAKTVLFISGLGEDAATAWGRSKVPDAIATDARACLYDRPGLGASGSATSAPRSVAQHVRDLEGVVEKLPLAPPVLLVAQGYGTFIARLYAKDRVRSVGGMVLVDPPLDVLDSTPPPGATPGQAAEYASITEFNADLGSFGAGALPPPPAPTIVLGATDLPAMPPGAPAGSPTTVPASGPSGPPGAAARRLEELRAGQAQLARKSPFGSFTYVEDAGTFIQYWNPDAVIKAVNTVLADPRSGR